MVTTWAWCKRRSRIAVATTGSPKTLPPVADRLVRRQQDGAGLVAAADQLEEEMGGIDLERQIAKLVDDQQLRFSKVGNAG